MRDYRNVSDHPEDLEDGRIIGVGETFQLDDDQQSSEYNKAKIEMGSFIDITGAFDHVEKPPTREELLAQAKELGISGRTTMTNPELQTAIIAAEAENKKEGGS